jgi:hypothetical protein
MTENVDKFRNLSHKDHRRAMHELKAPLGVLWSFSGDLNGKFEHLQHCHDVCSPTLDKTKAVVCKRVS